MNIQSNLRASVARFLVGMMPGMTEVQYLKEKHRRREELLLNKLDAARSDLDVWYSIAEELFEITSRYKKHMTKKTLAQLKELESFKKKPGASATLEKKLEEDRE